MSKLAFIPVLYGDAVLDEKLGFTVLSGDQLVAYEAIKYKATKIVIGADTDGLFDADQKLTPTPNPTSTSHWRNSRRFSLNLAKQQAQM